MMQVAGWPTMDHINDCYSRNTYTKRNYLTMIISHSEFILLYKQGDIFHICLVVSSPLDLGCLIRPKFKCFLTRLLAQEATPSSSVRNLDSALNFKSHISGISCACYYHTRDIRSIE